MLLNRDLFWLNLAGVTVSYSSFFNYLSRQRHALCFLGVFDLWAYLLFHASLIIHLTNWKLYSTRYSCSQLIRIQDIWC